MNKPRRNHLEILKEIDEILKNNGFETEQILLVNEINGSSTGSEICMKCGSTLLYLNQEKRIKKVIGKQINELIDYCHFNKLYPEVKQNQC